MNGTQTKEKIGFIGQGYIGKNYSDDFEERGYEVVRYSLEKKYKENKEKIQTTDIVFIAVPTPTYKGDFSVKIVEELIPLSKSGASVVVKSTLIPGTLEKLQKKFSNRFLFHSPEFLSKKTAREDARNPKRNIIGIPIDSDEYRDKATHIMNLLPKAPYELICTAREAELTKYINNTFFYTKTVFMNLMYEIARKNGCDWEVLKTAIEHEPWIANQHITPVHKSGRGAGGECLIKDFSALLGYYEKFIDDAYGIELLKALEKKNVQLLTSTHKDIEILDRVYGVELK